jgi:cell filamentation protein
VLPYIKDVEIKVLLQKALTTNIEDAKVYMKGIDHSYYYEGYSLYRTEDLKK